MTTKSLYDRAEEAGREAGERERKRLASAFHADGWEAAFLRFFAKEHPGFEAAYRRFAVGFDARNKRWVEGNDD